MRTLSENICTYANIFRQHFLSLSVRSPLQAGQASEFITPKAWPCERVRDVSSAGFSLVEISLAMLVVAIGMLSILGMFPAGLDQNARSISDTRAALFAQEVFSSLRVHAETNWQGIGSADIINLPAAASNNWHPDYDVSIWLDNQLSTNIYRHYDDSNIVDHAFRYRITLATNGLIKSAFLRFWPGEFGTTNSPTVFYSEFYQMKR